MSPVVAGAGPVHEIAVQSKKGRSFACALRYAPSGTPAATCVVVLVIMPIAPAGAVQRSSVTPPPVASATNVSGPPCEPHEGCELSVSSAVYTATAQKAVSSIVNRLA